MPEATYDDLVIYDSLEDCTTLYQVREPDSTPSGGTLTQVAHQWQIPSTLSAGGVANYGVQGATVQIPKGAVVSLLTQVDRTTAAGTAFSPKLGYTRDGGPAQTLTDTTGSDGVSFVGNGVDISIYRGAAMCCLTGALTPNDGTTQISADAIPTYGAGLNYSFTRRSVIKFTASASGVYCFFEQDQTGVPLNGGSIPASGACVTIVDQAAGTP